VKQSWQEEQKLPRFLRPWIARFATADVSVVEILHEKYGKVPQLLVGVSTLVAFIKRKGEE
jgi:phosphoserine phosphatase